jgi:hypothetical protein
MPIKVDWLWLIVGIAIGLTINGLLKHDKIPVSYPTATGIS